MVSWRLEPSSPGVPRADPAHEQHYFSHAILHCQSTSYYREHLLKSLSRVCPDSPVWLSGGLLLVLAALLRAEATNNPPDIFSSLPLSLASMGFHSLSVSCLVGHLFADLRLFRSSPVKIDKYLFFVIRRKPMWFCYQYPFFC